MLCYILRRRHDDDVSGSHPPKSCHCVTLCSVSVTPLKSFPSVHYSVKSWDEYEYWWMVWTFDRWHFLKHEALWNVSTTLKCTTLQAHLSRAGSPVTVTQSHNPHTRVFFVTLYTSSWCFWVQSTKNVSTCHSFFSFWHPFEKSYQVFFIWALCKFIIVSRVRMNVNIDGMVCTFDRWDCLKHEALWNVRALYI